MILIFGGTTEGRVAAAVCDRAARGYLYATKGADQRLLATYAEQITGALESAEIETLITERGVKLIIDAAHPYAEIVHQNITEAAAKKRIPTIRFERKTSAIEYDKVVWFESLASIVEHIKSEDISNILALTGVKSAAQLSPIAKSHNITLRIMDREESQQQILRAKFPEDNIIYYAIGADDNYDMSQIEGCKNLSAIVTKESGQSGGFEQKIKLAKSLNIPIFVTRRPALPQYSATIFGEHGLRREIERLLPHYYELRTGFTTGSAATAATVAALRYLLSSEMCQSIEIELPNGEPFSIDVKCIEGDGNYAKAVVIKDGGDDPDAIHNIEIAALVTLCDTDRNITIRGGEGVGIVTLPGIGVDVGEAAINPVPQQMIYYNAERELQRYNTSKGVDIEISVPQGATIATKTFNPRLGVVGGISILGTSGIVQPFSSEAFLESIERQIEVSKALGSDTIIINSGAMSERYLKTKYPDYLPQSYIHYGNLIGATIELAAAKGIKKVTLGVMIGKAVKLANGALDTHSKHVVLDREFLIEIAHKAECSNETIAQIAELTTARQLWTIIPDSEHELFQIIKRLCYNHCKPLLPNGELEVVLISESGETI